MWFRGRQMLIMSGLTLCQCGRTLLPYSWGNVSQTYIRILSSVSPSLLKKFRFQELFSNESLSEPLKSHGPSSACLSEVERGCESDQVDEDTSRTAALCSEITPQPDPRTDELSQCLQLTYSNLAFFSKHDILPLHRALHTIFRSQHTVYSKEDFDNFLTDVSEHDFAGALRVDFNAIPMESLLRVFCLVTSFVVDKKLEHSGRVYAPLGTALCDYLNDFSDLQLLEVAKLLTHWKIHSHFFKTLSVALDAEFQQRFIKYWSKSRSSFRLQLQAADLLFWLGQGELCSYFKSSLPSLLSKAKGSKMLLQVLFYYCFTCKSVEGVKIDMFDINRLSRYCNFEETLIAMYCLSWARVRISSDRLIAPHLLMEYIVENAVQNFQKDKCLLMTAKICERVVLDAKLRPSIFKLQQVLVARIETMALDTSIAVLVLGIVSGADNVEYLSSFIKRASKLIPYFETDLLCLLISSIATSSNEECLNFVKDGLQILRERKFPPTKPRHFYPKIVRSCLVRGLFLPDLWEKCLTDFRCTPGNISFDGGKLYLTTDALIEVFVPHYKGIRLTSQEKQHSLAALGPKINLSSTLLERVRKMVLKELQSVTSYVLECNILPFRSGDLVLCTDRDGSFLPVTHFKSLKAWEVKRPSESALNEGKRFVVVWVVPLHGRKYNNELKFHLWTQQKALKELGFHTIQVNAEMWIKSKAAEQRLNKLWLNSMLQSVIFK